MRRLEMTFPGILLELDVDLSAGLVRKLDQGDVDLAIVPGARADRRRRQVLGLAVASLLDGVAAV